MSYVNKWKYHVSARLMDEICQQPIIFGNMEDEHAIAVFIKLKHDLDLCMALGDFEHTNDWDPYIEIDTKDGDSFTTAPGYFQFDIGEWESKGYPTDPLEFEVLVHTNETETGDDKYVLMIGDIKEVRVYT